MTYFDSVCKFAENGIEFFPLKPGNDEVPYYRPKGWDKMGTSDLGQLQEWDEDSKYQGFAMVFKNQKAICFDLDLNHKDGADGISNFKAFATEYDVPAPSVIIRTPSGGMHVLYKHPGFDVKGSVGYDFKMQKAKQDNGIDIRADKNFIASFGVMRNDGNHNNASYEIVKGDIENLSSLPQRFVDTLPKADVYNVPLSRSDLMMDTLKGLCGFADDISNTPMYGIIPEKIFDGTRDDVFASLTSSWAAKGYPRETMVILADEAAKRCETFPDFNVYDKVDSALNNPKVRYSQRSLDMEYLLKDLVFLSNHNKYMFLHDKSIMNGNAVAVILGHIYVEIEKPLTAKQQEKEDNGAAVEKKTKRVPIFNIFPSQTGKMIAKTVGYKPGASPIFYDDIVCGDVANLYTSPGIVPRHDKISMDKFIEFASVICGDKDKGKILIEFIAFMIQNPAIKIGVALVIITRQGSGKNFFLKIVKRLLGSSNVFIANSGNIQSNFNAMLAQHQLIVINEATGNSSGTAAGKRNAKLFESRWKTMITDSDQAIELKGVDTVQQKTYGNFLVFSNDVAAVSFDEMERRHMCFVNDNPTMTDEAKSKLDEFEFLKSDNSISAIQQGMISLELETVSENMSHTEKTEDDKIVFRGNLDEHSKSMYDDIENKSYVFNDDVISMTAFKWYCVHKFGCDVHKDSVFIKRLLKAFYTPLALNNKTKAAKQVKGVESSPFYIQYGNDDKSFQAGGVNSHSLYIRKPLIGKNSKISTDFSVSDLKGIINRNIGGLKKELGLQTDKTERPKYIKEAMV